MIHYEVPLDFETPSVSCLMWTTSPVRKFAKAIECFQQQTYPNRELIVICCEDNIGRLPNGCRIMGHVGVVSSLINKSRLDQSVIVYSYRDPSGYKQIAFDAARGRYVMIWDENHQSSPTRIAEQVKLLMKKGIGMLSTIDDLDGNRLTSPIGLSSTKIMLRSAIPISQLYVYENAYCFKPPIRINEILGKKSILGVNRKIWGQSKDDFITHDTGISSKLEDDLVVYNNDSSPPWWIIIIIVILAIIVACWLIFLDRFDPRS